MTIPNRELALLALLSAATIAVAQMPATSGASGVQAAKPAASAAGVAMLSAADKDFFIKAAQGGHTEVESSKLAANKAASADVKSFAQQMVTDHTKAGDELMALATSKGVTAPKEPSPAQKSKIKSLEGKTGAEFDRMYAKAMGADHRETVALFKKTSTSAKDPDVKAFAAKTLPTLEHHLKMAEDLNKSVAKK